MKSLIKYILLSVIVAVVIFALVRYCERTDTGMVMVRQSFLDSLSVVANTPPRIEYKDTIIYKDTTIFRFKDKLVPVYVDSNNIKTYSDSIVNNDIDAKVDLRVNGELLSIDWRYKPVIREITKEITITKPEPVPYEVKVPAKGILISVGFGYGERNVLFSGDVGLITKDKKYFGAEIGNIYIQSSQKNVTYYKAKIGLLF